MSRDGGRMVHAFFSATGNAVNASDPARSALRVKALPAAPVLSIKHQRSA